jgi:hypothetical protein
VAVVEVAAEATPAAATDRWFEDLGGEDEAGGSVTTGAGYQRGHPLGRRRDRSLSSGRSRFAAGGGGAQ